ncbi:MAG: hypothetical protein IPL26_14590 [Leptospiraceae bacterium]|nr:hypothetical protein [Leptospiraceae bacterium]
MIWYSTDQIGKLSLFNEDKNQNPKSNVKSFCLLGNAVRKEAREEKEKFLKLASKHKQKFKKSKAITKVIH